jgi:hypothetical protein
MPSGSLPSDEALARAAYGLALRITGNEQRAAASVETAVDPHREGRVAFLGAVRNAARARRAQVPDRATAARPPRLNGIPVGDWAVVERIALRGMTVTEVAETLGLDRRETLLRLHRGLVASRSCLLGEGQPRDDADAPRLQLLDGEVAAGRLDDAAGDRQPEAGAASSVAG